VSNRRGWRDGEREERGREGETERREERGERERREGEDWTARERKAGGAPLLG
jgi:hypothetical protein